MPDPSPLAALRERRFGQRPATVWMTGLSGAGKSTLAAALEHALLLAGRPVLVLDGDVVREGLNRGLGFSTADREENVRRVAEVARLANEAGLLVLAALISPLAAQRALARGIVGGERFVEVHLSTTLAVCAGRDPKGLYAKAMAGGLADFTGIGAAYEPPQQPDLRIDAGSASPAAAASAVLDLLHARGFLLDQGRDG
ncbi:MULTISPECIES: adenylyl-sulfate kinase [unclassified Rhizobacter]|uniref:adenylyl-sulfate kinase n=1 Tax=unclassified Rhizobacter TaxID=2640088 RepID=UPI001F2A555B|nr:MULTISPECIES: adenylyl-sulfate kinase [unclassified Rhizobacter]